MILLTFTYQAGRNHTSNYAVPDGQHYDFKEAFSKYYSFQNVCPGAG